MAARSVAACSNCRKVMLRSFIASIGGPAYAFQRRAITTASTPTDLELHENDAALDSVHKKQPLSSSGTSREPSSTAYTPFGQAPPPSVTKAVQDSPHIPWYLQGQLTNPTLRAAERRQARDVLPPLPEHAPPLLEPLLEQLSTTLGVDDIALVDLRRMDPPPALGANLLMLVATARSEKHLHVSADRLCRWLRTNYLLRPFADGLLGRNELKLRARRLEKKKRLLSAVGSRMTAEQDADDGIRTGWVCVNIGLVPGGELPKTEAQIEAEKNIVGFSTPSHGSRIVVQLMTEEKREELGLERLWNGVLKMNVRRQEEIARGRAAAAAGDEYIYEEEGVPGLSAEEELRAWSERLDTAKVPEPSLAAEELIVEEAVRENEVASEADELAAKEASSENQVGSEMEETVDAAEEAVSELKLDAVAAQDSKESEERFSEEGLAAGEVSIAVSEEHSPARKPDPTTL